MRRISVLTAIATMLLGAAACRQARQASSPVHTDPDKYYAVLLNNGSAFFGKLEGLGTAYPVLTDVYYIQTSTNPETKAASNVLLKRGKVEWHAPDRMMINEKAIVFVEPVGPDSKVAQLIAEAKRGAQR
jgi:hypothetical protein